MEYPIIINRSYHLMSRSRTVSVISRVLAAAVGGYAFAYFAAAALAVLLPVVRSEAAVIAMLTGLLFYAGAIMWVFNARSATHAWLGLAGITLVCVVLTYLPGISA